MRHLMTSGKGFRGRRGNLCGPFNDPSVHFKVMLISMQLSQMACQTPLLSLFRYIQAPVAYLTTASARGASVAFDSC